MADWATAEPRLTIQMADASSIDHEYSGTRASVMPAGRWVITVVATQTAPRARATIIAASDTLPSRAASWSDPPVPPSPDPLVTQVAPNTTHAPSDTSAVRGEAMAGEPMCNGTKWVGQAAKWFKYLLPDRN